MARSARKRPYTPAYPKPGEPRIPMTAKEMQIREKEYKAATEAASRYGRYAVNRNRKGKSSELIAAAFLICCGFDVYMPFKSAGIDLLGVDSSNAAYRFEVRSLRSADEDVLYNFVEMRDADKGRTDYYIGVDDFGICVVFASNGCPLHVHDYNWHTPGIIQGLNT